MQQYLFLFTITDVQNFIKQARKAQDLFAGSQMLADWIDAAADAFEAEGGELIFPHADTRMKPNRFLGTLKNAENLQGIGEAVEDAVRNKVWELARNSLHKALGLDEKDWPAGAKEQIAAFPDVRWAFTSYGEKKSYKEAHFELERTVAALKQVRFTAQLNYQEDEQGNTIEGERGRKCSVDGQRNMKFYRLSQKEYKQVGDKAGSIRPDEVLAYLRNNKWFVQPEEEVRVFVDEATSKTYRLHADNRFTVTNREDIIADGEGLSAVSMLKRCYPEIKSSEPYPDTAQISTLDSILKAEGDILNKLCEYRNLFKGKRDPITERCLEAGFKINLNDEGHTFDFEYLFEENLWKIPAEIQNAKDVHDKINIAFHSSYALLSFDGDNIGKWLAGDAVKDTREFHAALAENLKDFANEVEQVFTRKRGRIIYNGGDDFLAMVTLPALFQVMEEIRTAFGKITPNLQSHFIDPDEALTLSFGVTVAHYKTPLHKVLDYTRDTLKQAKKRYEKPVSMFERPKNAFGISILSKSSLVAQHYCKLDEWKHLEALIDKLSSGNGEEGKLSNKFMFTFLREFAPILAEEMTYDDYLTTCAAGQTELKRLMERNGGKIENNRPLKALFIELTQVLHNQVMENAPNAYTFDYDNLRGFMKTAEQLKRTNAF